MDNIPQKISEEGTPNPVVDLKKQTTRRRLRWMGVSVGALILTIGLAVYPAKFRLVGAWRAGGFFVTGSQVLEFWPDGVFRATRSGVIVHEGIWRVRGFRLEMEIVRQKQFMGEYVRSYDYRKSWVVLLPFGSEPLRLSAFGKMHRWEPEEEGRPIKGEDWPERPVPPEPFFTAVVQGDVAKARRCLGKQPGLINQKNRDGCNALMTAIAQGNLPIVQMLLSKGAEPNSTNVTGTAALSVAMILHEDTEALGIVEALLKAGANPNHDKSPDQSTPLHVAVFYARPACVAALLRKKADPMLRVKDGRTALDLAKRSKDSGVLRILESYTKGQTETSTGNN